SFRIWAPIAPKAELIIYNNRHDTIPVLRMSMRKSIAGTWTVRLMGNQEFKLYAFRVMINGKWMMEVPDPYAKATSVNGRKAVILNLKKTNPTGWEKDKSPVLKNKTDAIIYELHIRDASIANNSGIKNKGKYLGLTEKPPGMPRAFQPALTT
ncbi:MAG TPA: type I pullulanase, partial [Chitinophagaceae bacterium]|nr:type I pullulanase [Chitinophagaceae bacterium]